MIRWAVGGVWTVDRVSNPKRGNKADEGEGGESDRFYKVVCLQVG